MSAASIITLPPRAFDALLHATDPAVCQPACEQAACCEPIDCGDPARPCDIFDCGLLLQQALREIDLLRSGLENAADLRATRDAAAQPGGSVVPRSGEHQSGAAKPHGSARALYAVRALGDIPFSHSTPATVDVQQTIMVQMVTNLGTLMNVLI